MTGLTHLWLYLVYFRCYLQVTSLLNEINSDKIDILKVTKYRLIG